MQSSSSSFELINKSPGNSSSLQSSLYRFIEDLINEEHDLIKDKTYEIKHNTETGRQYVMFQLEAPSCSMQRFSCTRCHLTIDKIYATDKTKKSLSGFSIAHYTAYYYDLVSEKEFLVHCYFNDFGKYFISQIKYNGYQLEDQDLADTKLGIDRGLLLQLESAAIKDCSYAEQLLCKFLQKKSERYLDAIEEASKLETSFQNLLREIYKLQFTQQATELNQKLRELENIANKFSEAIAKINRYCDKKIDPRGQLIQEALIKVKSGFTECDRPSSVSEENEQTDEIEGKIITSNNKRQIMLKQEAEKQEDLFKKIITEYELLKKIQKSKDFLTHPTKQYEQYQYVDKINSLMLDFYCFSRQPESLAIDMKKHEKLQSIENEIYEIPSLIEVFKQKCYEFDEKNVEFLLEKFDLEILITKHFCSDLLTKMFSIEAEAVEEQKIVKLGNILFEKLQSYREAIILLGSSDCFAVRMNTNLACNFALAAITAKRYNLLEMIFSQGWDPNNVLGVLGQSYRIELPISIIWVTFILHKEKLKQVIELLIRYNARLEIETRERQIIEGVKLIKTECFSEEMLSKKTLKEYKKFSKKMSKFSINNPFSDVSQDDLTTMFESNSCLEFVCYVYGAYKVCCNVDPESVVEIEKAIDILANNTSLKNVCRAFASLIGSNMACTRWLVGTLNSQLHVVDSKEDANRIANDTTLYQDSDSVTEDKKDPNSVSLVFYTNSIDTQYNHKVADLIRILRKTMIAKLNEKTFEDIFDKRKGLYSELMLEALKNSENEDSFTKNMQCLNACLLLVISRFKQELGLENYINKIINILKLQNHIKSKNHSREVTVQRNRGIQQYLENLLKEYQTEPQVSQKNLLKFSEQQDLQMLESPQSTDGSIIEKTNQGIKGIRCIIS